MGESSGVNLSRKSVHGLVWLACNSVSIRLITFGNQVILAWLLEPDAFGLISIAYAIVAFASLAQQNGLDRILIANQNRYESNATPAFWILLLFGILTGGLLWVVAPLAAAVYKNSALTHIIWVLAIATPFDALKLVPQSKLSIDLRFDAIAVVNMLTVLAQSLLTIFLAYIGFGALSFVLPLLFVKPVVALGLFMVVRPPIRMGLEIDKWLPLLQNSLWIILSSMLAKVVQQGDYLIIGASFSTATVGLYYMAYSLSMQASQLVTASIQGMLFPVLSKLANDHDRLMSAFYRTISISMLIYMPASVLMAVTAEPVIQLLFGESWTPAILLLQILAVGMSFRILGAACWALLNAQAKFKRITQLTALESILFVSFAFVGVQFGVVWFTVAVALFYATTPLLAMPYALGFNSETFKVVMNISIIPTVVSTTASAVVLVAFTCFPTSDSPWVYIGMIITAASIFLAILISSLYFVKPFLRAELVRLLRFAKVPLGSAA